VLCYIVTVLRMTKGKNKRLGLHSTRLLLIVLTISALTASLVTRTVRIEIVHCRTAQSNSPQALRQHLDRDAIPWAPPTPALALLPASTFRPRTGTSGLPLPRLLLDESLYNRPPPSC
jgi:hypothetical protein